MSKTTSIKAATAAALRARGLTAPRGSQASRASEIIASALDLFERDPAAKATFLARIPTRFIPVKAATARRAAQYRERMYSKAGHAVPGQSFIDDAINRALDKAEAKVAKRSRR
jgi:hypothetical protein